MLKAQRTEKEAGDLLSTYLLQGWVTKQSYNVVKNQLSHPFVVP